MKKYILLSLLSITILTSCKKDSIYIIDQNVKYEYDNFFSEARKRGVNIDSKSLTQVKLMGKLNVISDNGLSAPGYYDSRQKAIFLDTTSEAFKYNLEVLMFHEMGHAILKRDHLNTFLQSPSAPLAIIPKSIMHGNTLPNYQTQLFKRQYYIDELFNANTAKPYWL